MLKEEQIAELLTRHEKIIGDHHNMVRGNLRNAETRAAAVWELVVLDAAARIGQVEYESHPGASPDINLHFPEGRHIWIEVAYLYPRFWQEDRKMDSVVRWIYSKAKRLKIPQFKVFPSFEGRKETNAGPVLELPDQHKKEEFLHDSELVGFFKQVKANPNQKHICSLSHYSISLEYQPNAKGPFVGWSGIDQEAPKTIGEHLLYRVLKDKIDQHNVSGPRIVCVGSDVSPVLRHLPSPGGISNHDVVMSIFKNHSSLSAVIIVSIDDVPKPFHGFDRRARKQIILNPFAREPLTSEESLSLNTIDFNHWKYTYSLPKEELPNNPKNGRLSGNLTRRLGLMGDIIEIPAHIVIDALAGKKSLEDYYRVDDDDYMFRLFKERWEVISCSFKEGDKEAGEPSKIVFELVSPVSPFWPPKPDSSSETQSEKPQIDLTNRGKHV